MWPGILARAIIIACCGRVELLCLDELCYLEPPVDEAWSRPEADSSGTKGPWDYSREPRPDRTAATASVAFSERSPLIPNGLAELRNRGHGIGHGPATVRLDAWGANTMRVIHEPHLA